MLAKYVGTYVEQPKFWRLEPRTVVITVSDGTLYGDMDGRGKVPLVAQSPTLFSGLYGLGVEFVTDAGGVPASLFVKHVSGDYRFAPKRSGRRNLQHLARLDLVGVGQLILIRVEDRPCTCRLRPAFPWRSC